MVGIPTTAPNYSTVRDKSAWWLETLPDGSRRVVATTGYGFVAALQRNLINLSLSWPPTYLVYGGGRGDVSMTITSQSAMAANGNWDAGTNARLWYWLKTKRDAETNAVVQHAIQHAMDEVERVRAENPSNSPVAGAFVNIEALRAAMWLVHYRDQSYQYVIDHVNVTGTAAFADAIVPPPYFREAAPIPEAAAQLIYVWNPDLPAETPAEGMSYRTKVVIGVAAVAAIGGLAYYLMRDEGPYPHAYRRVYA